ncbi:MAG: DUF1295 domain-containing protein [Deltaproteobacteria bacterium]|nr:DUF1295 domain-containing protein [Deltaproteobacteria bacterium]
MNETTFFQYLLVTMFILAGLVFIVLLFVAAPYGKFTRPGFGPRMNRRLGWIVMETPSVLVFAACFITGTGKTTSSLAGLAFLFTWMIHYVHRAFVFPFRLKGGKQNMTVLAVIMGFLFTSANSYLNARWLYALSPGYGNGWLFDPRFLSGMAVFLLGLVINQHSDTILISLRQPGQTGYKLPTGGLFRFVSCPNYLGEIMEWLGWAVATWSLPGLAFFAWTVANLGPRSVAQHKWYIKHFKNYPGNRKALVPFLF